VKVLYVLRYYPTLTETFVYREMSALLERGVEVEAVAIGSREDGSLQDELPDVRVHRPPRGAWAWGKVHLRPKDAARAVWVGELARRIGVDRLHAHFAGEAAEWARVAASVAGVPYSVTVHAVDLYKPRPSFSEVVAGARPLLTVAETNREEIRRRTGASAALVRCGVEPDRYRRAVVDGPGPLRVVAVGRWVPKKGFDLLVDAVEALDVPVSLRLVADAPAGVASARVKIGAAAPSEIAALLADADVFALPCRIAEDGDRDGIPVALMEAMAAGLPVITGAVNGIPELVDDAVGWLLPPGDAGALRQALLAAAAAPAERARRGAAAAARVVQRGFTVNAQVDGLLAAWGQQ
jgi:glycosyltransferase involved in cell wall biosynthesis